MAAHVLHCEVGRQHLGGKCSYAFSQSHCLSKFSIAVVTPIMYVD